MASNLDQYAQNAPDAAIARWAYNEYGRPYSEEMKVSESKQRCRRELLHSMDGLMGGLKGKKSFDAGRGDGSDAKDLAGKSAQVIAVDVSNYFIRGQAIFKPVGTTNVAVPLRTSPPLRPTCGRITYSPHAQQVATAGIEVRREIYGLEPLQNPGE